MKITLDTSDPNREAFLDKLTELVKTLDCYGSPKPKMDVALKKSGTKKSFETPIQVMEPNLDQLLRLEVMMQSLPGVVCSLTLGGDPDYATKSLSTRELAHIFGDDKILEAINDYAPPKLTPKKKHRPSPYEK